MRYAEGSFSSICSPQGQSGYAFDSTPRLNVPSITADQWVSTALYAPGAHLLCAAIDTAIYAFDYQKGALFNCVRQAHRLSITKMDYVESQRFLVSASKDGTGMFLVFFIALSTFPDGC